MSVEGFKIRPADFSRKGEMHFIVKSWLACDRLTDAAKSEGPTYPTKERSRILSILSNPSSSILVAYSDLDENALAGFLVRTGSHLHYVYVRRSAQGIGLARELCKDLPETIVTTHQPLDKRPLPKGWTYKGYSK